jgi:heat shock protein HslJ
MKEKTLSNNKLGQYTLIIVLSMISLLGCSQKTDELADTSWELVSLNGKDLIEGTAITLVFTESYLGGQMGCNGYGGSPDTGKYNIKHDGTSIRVSLCCNRPTLY